MHDGTHVFEANKRRPPSPHGERIAGPPALERLVALSKLFAQMLRFGVTEKCYSWLIVHLLGFEIG
jgi:hypothetical protein